MFLCAASIVCGANLIIQQQSVISEDVFMEATITILSFTLEQMWSTVMITLTNTSSFQVSDALRCMTRTVFDWNDAPKLLIL